MSAHLSADLPRLLSGEATREETLAAADHLRGCPDCQQELVSAAVAHASLASAYRFAPELIVRPAGSESEVTHTHTLPDSSLTSDRVRSETAAAPSVWLADNAGQNRRPLGFVGADRRANLPVPTSVMARYSVVAISVQQTNDVAFSGDLAARGAYH